MAEKKTFRTEEAASSSFLSFFFFPYHDGVEVAFSSLERILGECATIHSPPALSSSSSSFLNGD